MGPSPIVGESELSGVEMPKIKLISDCHQNLIHNISP
jgi:hypothetical protein